MQSLTSLTSLSPLVRARRNDYIWVYILIFLGFSAAIFCIWHGGSLVWSFWGKNGLLYVACKKG